MSHWGQKMYPSRAFLLLCLPGCFTLSIPRILEATVGGVLVTKCQYGVGDAAYRKFWCRGATWQDCARVIETERAAEEEVVRRGRVTLRHMPHERSFLVIMADLEEGDADIYWCGVDKAGSAPQTPVAVTVFPGLATMTKRTMALPPSATQTPTRVGVLAPTSLRSSPCPPTCPSLLWASLLFLAFLKAALLLSFACAAVWVAWLQHCL